MSRAAGLAKGIFQTIAIPAPHTSWGEQVISGGQAGHPSVGAEQLHCALPVLGFIPLSLFPIIIIIIFNFISIIKAFLFQPTGFYLSLDSLPHPTSWGWGK